LEQVYFNGYIWFQYKSRNEIPGNEMGVYLLEDALYEQLLRVCEWALDTLALLEPQGIVALGRNDLDLHDESQRMDMIEIVESFGNKKLRELIISILEFESWQTIAKKGKQLFNFTNGTNSGLGHLLQSENKWICVCTLYGIMHFPDRNKIVQEEKETIAGFTKNVYPYLADIALQVVQGNDTINQGKYMNAYTLLETVLFFKKTQLFHNVPAEKLMGLAEISEVVTYPKGSVISKENDISNHLYIVKSGSLKIIKMKKDVKTLLSIIRTGEAYGEIGLFNQSPRSASAVANENCEVFVIQRSSLKKLLMEIPEIAYNFLEIFGEKLRKSSEELTLLHTTLSAKNISDGCSRK
jgi:CRP-like cAMP-binding protein